MSTHIALKAAGAEEHAGHLHLEHRHSSASPMKRSSGSGATLMAGKRGGRLLLVTAPLLLLALTAGLLRAPSPCKRRSLLTSFMPGRCTMALQPSGGPQEKEAPLEQQAAPQQQVTAAADEQKAAPKQQAALDPRLHPRQESFDRLQADTGLALHEPGLLAEFQAAPWLLPPDAARLLPYTGVHDLDRLLALRAAPAGGHPSTACSCHSTGPLR